MIRIARALRASDGLAFVREEEGNILGFSCARDVGFLGYLSPLVGAEFARGEGIGTELIIRIQQELAQRGCVTLISDVWQDAVSFYEALRWSTPAAVLLRHRFVRSSS
jgi:GNAT superfamily N-acetyltransferase